MSRAVAVVGAGEVSGEEEHAAEEVGAGLARLGCAVVTGGLGGVMQAACRGAKSRRGSTLAFLPGEDPRTANGWVDLPLVTGLGEARNLLVVRNARAVIAIGGGHGTLSEIGFALKLGRPVIGLGTWPVHGVAEAGSPADVIQRVARLL